MSFEFTLLDALQALRCPVLDALAVFFDQAGAHGEIWIAFTAVLLAFRRTRRAGLDKSSFSMEVFGKCFVLQ